MNAAVRATVRVGIYTGAKVYFVHEVCTSKHTHTHIRNKELKVKDWHALHTKIENL